MVGKSGKVQDLNCNHQVDTEIQKSMVSESEKYILQIHIASEIYIFYLRNTVYRIREKLVRKVV